MSCEHSKPRPALGLKSSGHSLGEGQELGQVRETLTGASPAGTPFSGLLGAEALERKERSLGRALGKGGRRGIVIHFLQRGRPVILQVGPLDQPHEHHLGMCSKVQILRTTPNPVRQAL